MQVPDRFGIRKDVVLGFDDLDSYVSRNTPYLGAAVGRCANRIGFASFEIDGQKYGLAKNVAKEHHLHGGLVGFDKVSFLYQRLGRRLYCLHIKLLLWLLFITVWSRVESKRTDP